MKIWKYPKWFWKYTKKIYIDEGNPWWALSVGAINIVVVALVLEGWGNGVIGVFYLYLAWRANRVRRAKKVQKVTDRLLSRKRLSDGRLIDGST